MKETRFIKLLMSFNKKEVDGFGHFLQCFHQKKERALQLYGYLEKQYPRFPDKNLALGHLSKTVYPKESNPKKKILNTLSDLYGWAKDYLIWQHQTGTGLKKDLLWLDVLNDRDMGHEFGLKAQQIDQTLEQEEPADTWDYLDRLAFHHKVWTHASTKRHSPKMEVLDKCIDNLDLFYFVSKKNYHAEKLNRTGLYKEGGDPHNAEKRESYFEKPPENLLAKVATLQLQLVNDKKEEDYLQLRNIYFAEESQLSKQNLSILLQHLINYTAGNMRGKDKHYYYSEAFQLYEHGLQSKLLLSNGPFTSHTFINITSTSLWLDKIEWAEQFINNYARYIDPPARRPTELLARAQLAFIAKDHSSQYFTELQTMSFPDPHYAIRVKTLILRNLYEAKEDKSTLLLFNNAFKKYLSRNKKIKGPILTSCENFSKCFRLLILNRMSSAEFEIEVKNTTPLFMSEWLLLKAENLNGKG